MVKSIPSDEWQRRIAALEIAVMRIRPPKEPAEPPNIPPPIAIDAKARKKRRKKLK